MAGEGPKVHVAASTRMPNPDDPDDVIHGKRFVHPGTGEPASIPDVLVALGMLRPETETGNAPGADGAAVPEA